MSIPHPHNFCGGNFQDWMEVMLTAHCNGKCAWCIERDGFHPPYRVDGEQLARIINKDPRKNVLFLGGEPTLYQDLSRLSQYLENKNIYFTTNGSNLLAILNFRNLMGVNISIHHYDLQRNQQITGIDLSSQLYLISAFLKKGVKIRFNCNLIQGEIDSKEEIMKYIAFAKTWHVDSVRFAELKDDKDHFVDLYTIFSDQYGINPDPFFQGCNSDCEIEGMAVNFRQMCGLQTPQRPCPIHPQQATKTVLYYNGLYYQGWQKALNVKKLLELVAEGTLSVKDAEEILGTEYDKDKIRSTPLPRKDNSGAGCTY